MSDESQWSTTKNDDDDDDVDSEAAILHAIKLLINQVKSK